MAEVAAAAVSAVHWKRTSHLNRMQIKQTEEQRMVLVLSGGVSVDDLPEGSAQRTAFCAQLALDVSDAAGGAVHHTLLYIVLVLTHHTLLQY
jgi:hypothetical protein